MKNRELKRKKKIDLIKDYVKNRLKNLDPKLGKQPASNRVWKDVV
ncbi:hypothetical protein [Metabacillus kandeliae]|nr:hypothetical protein [Metabacillus kandeliae]